MADLDTFRTERLLARRMVLDDVGLLTKLYQDERVMATLGGVRTAEQTRSYVDASLEHWRQHGFGLWMMHDKATGDFIGRGGLRNLEQDGQPEVEVGYAVRAEYWRQGFATEMARAYVDVAFTRLGLSNVVTFTLPTNLGSRRVMEKAGFTYERDIIHAGEPHVLYRRRALSGGALVP